MDEESTTTSSSASPSPLASPEASIHGPPTLEQLISHFVTAKRSLSCISHVSHANALVTEGRCLIEEIATTTARNSFARHGVDEQLETLNAIRDGILGVSDDVVGEFTETVRLLDEANDRLEGTLERLRGTVVDAALQRGDEFAESSRENEDDEDEDEEAGPRSTKANVDKTLYDFIDEHRHHDIATSLRSLIDSYNSSQHDLHNSLAAFDDYLRIIAEILQEPTVTGSSGPQDKRTLYDEQPPTIPDLFRNMDTHAGEMAQLLQNLVAHYDLCVTALRHTEGGGEAAKAAIQQAGGFDSTRNAIGAPAAEESLYGKKVAEPIGEVERAEMLKVVESDANEVEEVVGEIREHAEGMEREYGMLLRHALDARAGRKALRNVLDQLYEIKEALPRYISHSHSFRTSWTSTNHLIQIHTSDLSTLGLTYEDFLDSYSHMLSEVERRKAADAAIQRFAHKAQKELDRLCKADSKAREEFMREFGKSLPGDIWPGARDMGRRWAVRPVGEVGEDD